MKRSVAFIYVVTACQAHRLLCPLPLCVGCTGSRVIGARVISVIEAHACACRSETSRQLVFVLENTLAVNGLEPFAPACLTACSSQQAWAVT